ncbi:MAG: GNAT family N-acetyltransferase, partial [Alphaproteobacteria bacterium]|nr:GNAT family N-acetyltransferase [Alphaproteobacteria bacterium]
LIDYGGKLACLGSKTIQKLNTYLPSNWSRTNPIDIIGDANPERYAKTLEVVLSDQQTEAVLVINCPTALASSVNAAQAVIDTITKNKFSKPILTSWLGDAYDAHRLLDKHNIPVYNTPEDAVHSFIYLNQYVRSQKILMYTPSPLPLLESEIQEARIIIHSVLQENRTFLIEPEVKRILDIYKIPTVQEFIVKTMNEALAVVETLLKKEQKIVIKILSREIIHKSDVGGVALNIQNRKEAQKFIERMIEKLNQKIEGFIIQPMIHRSNSHELILGIGDDKIFGPTILFGAGGTAVEIIKDMAIELPPLDINLAHDLLKRTSIYKRLKGYRNTPPAAINDIILTLIKLSAMASDLPEISELDINPLLVDDKGVLALDARIVLNKLYYTSKTENQRMAICPYPKSWEKEKKLTNNKNIFIRPIKAEDIEYCHAFLQKMKPHDLQSCMMTTLQYFTQKFLTRYTQTDYMRSMVFIAFNLKQNEILGIAHLNIQSDYTQAECSIMVRSDYHNQGIGTILMQILIDYAIYRNIHVLWEKIMKTNKSIKAICNKFEFQFSNDLEDADYQKVTLIIN